MAKKFINLCVLPLMAQWGQNVAALRAAGAGGGPARQQNRAPKIKNMKDWYTVVVYEKPRVKTVVLYVGGDVFVFKVPAGRVIDGVVKKTWSDGKAYSMRVKAVEIAKLIHMYASEEATMKITMLDPVFRAAARQGYRVHRNDYYVKLWLSKPLGEPLGHVGEIDELALGDCLKHFTHSYRIWRMVTPPWAATC
jgi:hypothetical protein